MQLDRTYERGLKQTIDWALVIVYLLLVFIGWLNIYAAGNSGEPAPIFDLSLRSGKQIIWIATAFILAALILFVFNPRLWEVISPPVYLLVLLLLIAVIFLGVEINGSRSWFAIGSALRFQPAEISKLATALMLSMVMSRPTFKISNMRDLGIVAAIIAVPMLIIIAESEMGSALVYLAFLFVLYREGLSGWFLFALGLAILIFILTLTASTYTAVLVLGAIVTLCFSLLTGRFREWLKREAVLIAFLGVLPWAWRYLCETLVPGSSILGTGVDPSVEGAILGASRWTSLLSFKPEYVLFGIIILTLPVQAFQAFRDKHVFRWTAIITMVVGIALTFSTSFIFNNVLKDHQRQRIEVLLGLKEDPTGVGYNVNQSMIAIGSGGLFGKGFLNGTQTTYGFVPEQSTDFIFCTVGEEWGFVGCAVVILLYVFMIWRIINDAEQCREHFTRIYGYCVAGCIFMHLFINIGMTIGLMPVIGIPLPLLSYGGSSLWAFTVMIFIFIALYREENKYF